jgi:hypothetical protein
MTQDARPSRVMKTIFISHGGGPCFWIDFPPPFDPCGFTRLAAYFGGIVDALPEWPSAILVVTAHLGDCNPDIRDQCASRRVIRLCQFSRAHL